MVNINWLYLEDDKPEYDLVGTIFYYTQKYVDIIYRYNNTWTIIVDGTTISEDCITSRSKAIEVLQSYLDKKYVYKNKMELS